MGVGGWEPCTVLRWSPMRAAKANQAPAAFQVGTYSRLTASGVACCICPVPGRPWLGMRLMQRAGGII